MTPLCMPSHTPQHATSRPLLLLIQIEIFRHDANLTFVTLAAVPAPREEEHKRTWPTLHTPARWPMNALTLPDNRATAARGRPKEIKRKAPPSPA